MNCQSLQAQPPSDAVAKAIASLPPDKLAKARELSRIAYPTAPKVTRVFKRLPLYPKQAAIVDDPHRFTITEATTKAGKTMSHLEHYLERGIAANEGEWWWVAPIAAQANIAFRRAERRLNGFIDSGGNLKKVSDPIPFSTNKSERFIEVGGARFWFKGADNPDSLYGEDVRGAVGDEITRWKEDSWHAVYTTLSATEGWFKGIGNVKGKKNFAYKLARKAEAGESDWGYHKLTAQDAIEGGVLKAGIVEAARRDLPPAVYKELYEAEASEDGSNPFDVAAIRDCTSLRSTAEPVCFGWDLAKSVDWTVGVGLDRSGAVAVFERFQRSWDDTIKAILVTTGQLDALIDSTGVGDPVLEQLQKGRTNFEGFKFTAPSKQQLMEGLAVAIQQRAIRFPDGPIVSELDSFEYEYTRTGVRYSAPEGMHDDCVMALALAVRQLGEARAPGDLGVTF